MFLNALRNDTKEIFLKLCVQGSLINDNFENEEKEIISDYCREMDVEVHIPENKENLYDFLALLSKNTKDRKSVV